MDVSRNAVFPISHIKIRPNFPTKKKQLIFVQLCGIAQNMCDFAQFNRHLMGRHILIN